LVERKETEEEGCERRGMSQEKRNMKREEEE